jgi:hypothetical protein
MYPNWDFGFENIPSGNPGSSSYLVQINPFQLCCFVDQIKGNSKDSRSLKRMFKLSGQMFLVVKS